MPTTTIHILQPKLPDPVEGGFIVFSNTFIGGELIRLTILRSFDCVSK